MKNLLLPITGTAMLTIAFPGVASSQTLLKKDAMVMVKPPLKAFTDIPKKVLGKEIEGIFERRATVEIDATGNVIVGGRADWQSLGFPWLEELRVDKIEFKKDQQHTEVELKGPRASNLWVRFILKGDTQKAFDAVVVTATQAEAYRRDAYAALTPGIFTEGWAAIPESNKIQLLRFLDLESKASRFYSEDYKGRRYLGVHVGGGDVVYNDLQLNQSQRIAKVINERVLSVLKGFARASSGADEVAGIKLEFVLMHRDFLSEIVPKIETVELYVPTVLARQFAEADITSQQLIDGCVILAAGNRIQISLAND